MTQQLATRGDALMILIDKVATAEGLDISRLEHLLSVKERWDAEEARKGFVQAMTHFRADAPAVLKTNRVAHTGASYSHANLGEIAPAVAAALARYGLSHGWSVEQRSDGGVAVTCTLVHEQGHQEQVTIAAPPDDSGRKNAIQQIGSTITYLERYTLMAITGLAAQDMDDDGTGGPAPRRERMPQKDAIPPRENPWDKLRARFAADGVTEEDVCSALGFDSPEAFNASGMTPSDVWAAYPRLWNAGKGAESEVDALAEEMADECPRRGTDGACYCEGSPHVEANG